MRIAVCSDEYYAINDFVIAELAKRGHEVIRFGALAHKKEQSWALAARDAALAISNNSCDEGIFFCFSATGICMAANKVPGIRAALCVDAETARLARVWNHANVLALSHRLLTEELAKEILSAWFGTPLDPRGQNGVRDLNCLDKEFRQKSA